MIDPIESVRVCSICDIEKDISSFRKLKNKKGKEYNARICSICFNARAYTDHNINTRKEKRLAFLSTPEGKYSEFKRAKANSVNSNNITFDRFSSLLGEKCSYCGGDRDRGYLGLVKKDLGFVDDNVIPICRCCNQSKKMISEESFIRRAKRRYGSNDKETIQKRRCAERQKASLSSHKYSKLKSSAKTRGIFIDLSLKQYEEFFNLNCHYCDKVNETHGLDRIDNTKGYTIGNVVSCCKICNTMKNNMTYQDFISHIRNIIRNI